MLADDSIKYVPTRAELQTFRRVRTGPMSHPGRTLPSCFAATGPIEGEIKVRTDMRFLMENVDAVKLAIDLYATRSTPSGRSASRRTERLPKAITGRRPSLSYAVTRDGTQTRNVEPCPTVLSASIVPPSTSSTRRTM